MSVFILCALVALAGAGLMIGGDVAAHSALPFAGMLYATGFVATAGGLIGMFGALHRIVTRDGTRRTPG